MHDDFPFYILARRTRAAARTIHFFSIATLRFAGNTKAPFRKRVFDLAGWLTGLVRLGHSIFIITVHGSCTSLHSENTTVPTRGIISQP